VIGTFACYHHVIVVWNNVVYDYESNTTHPRFWGSLAFLSNASFRILWGSHTLRDKNKTAEEKNEMNDVKDAR
jgi:hypothetical protein